MEMCESLCAAGAITLGPVAETAEAELIIDTNAIDCAVVDIDLGNGPSYEVAEFLKRRGLPFVFTSGYDDAAVPAPYNDVPLLVKPYSEEALVEAVRKLPGGETGK
jgi:DNA-binding LytR/AlgR family response regulator